MELIQLTKQEMTLLAHSMGYNLKNISCEYCKEKIVDDKQFSVFTSPVRITCDSPTCLSQAMKTVEEGVAK